MVKEYQLLTISASSFRFSCSSISISNPPTSSSPIIQSMESREADELAIVKAAAWAWYEHGSGCQRRPNHEFDLTRSRPPPKPSRYKLEAMRDTNRRGSTSGSDTFESQRPVPSPCHTNSSLLDSYEIMSISCELGRVLDSTSTTNGHDRMTIAPPSESGRMVKKVAWKLISGFWLVRHAMGICGSEEKMVETTALRRRRRGSVVRRANCRP